MLPGKRDAEGRAYITIAAPDASTTYQGGIAISPLGQLHVTQTVSGSDVFSNGFRVAPTGQLVVANTPVEVFLEGIPRGGGGVMVRQVNTVPAASDPFVGGLRIGPLGGVYMTDAAP